MSSETDAAYRAGYAAGEAATLATVRGAKEKLLYLLSGIEAGHCDKEIEFYVNEWFKGLNL